jgi:hypothetical protein
MFSVLIYVPILVVPVVSSLAVFPVKTDLALDIKINMLIGVGLILPFDDIYQGLCVFLQRNCCDNFEPLYFAFSGSCNPSTSDLVCIFLLPSIVLCHCKIDFIVR